MARVLLFLVPLLIAFSGLITSIIFLAAAETIKQKAMIVSGLICSMFTLMLGLWLFNMIIMHIK
ncbi:hypothetical protein [Pseudomonas phage PhiPizzaParty]|nr:hypothetical protein [Pseudomonas phage PhiPizzaParty]